MIVIKVKRVFSQVSNKWNRIVSLFWQWCEKAETCLKIGAIHVLAWLLNGIGKRDAVQVIELHDAEKPDAITLNCMGAVCASDLRRCQQGISAIDAVLRSGDISLAYVSQDQGEKISEEFEETLSQKGITAVNGNAGLDSRLFALREGKIGLITYDRSKAWTSGKRISVELMREVLRLKRQNAEYILVYVHGPKEKRVVDSAETRLFALIGQLGVDYIVGVTQGCRDSGTTYLGPSGRLVRAVYSLGTFLGPETESSVMLRLRLRRVQGELRLYEETYLPFLYEENVGLTSLLTECEDGAGAKTVRRHRGEIEAELPRIRPADRILTVGMVAELLGAELPQKCQHLKDFSVGKICSRAVEVQPGDVFFFREAFNDANDLTPVSPRRRLRIARSVVRKGALLLVTSQKLAFPCSYLLCDNVVEAHIAVCAHLQKKMHMRTIAITGSVGKTSTKDMLAEVMCTKYQTVKNERNANIQTRIGINLQGLNSACEVYIQEIGGGRPGGASRHARMVLPEIAVVTNIGDAHIGNFDSKEALMRNKLQIVEGMQENGTVYLNGDDPMLVGARVEHRTVFFAVRNKNADYYAENIRTYSGRCYFDIVFAEGRVPVCLNVLGEYNVLHAVCCFAIAKQFGIPEADIVKGLARFHTTGIRQNLMEVCGRKLFMDCYNATLDSVEASMEMFLEIPVSAGHKRIAVVGDITGMGTKAERIHKELAHILLRYPVDQIILYGKDVRHTYQELQSLGAPVQYISGRENLNQTLRQVVNVGDAVVFKGSSKTLLEQSVDMVYGTRLTDERLEDEEEYKRVRKGAVVYHLFSSFATASAYMPAYNESRRVRIRGRIGGIRVVNMGRALRKTNVTEVYLPKTIRHISAEAFRGCQRLTEIHLPRALKYIGNGAFRGCSELWNVNLPSGVLHIGKEAFAHCRNLQRMSIPDSVVQIGENAFEGCESCCFICPEGSYAATYLKERNFVVQNG